MTCSQKPRHAAGPARPAEAVGPGRSCACGSAVLFPPWSLQLQNQHCCPRWYGLPPMGCGAESPADPAHIASLFLTSPVAAVTVTTALPILSSSGASVLHAPTDGAPSSSPAPLLPLQPLLHLPPEHPPGHIPGPDPLLRRVPPTAHALPRQDALWGVISVPSDQGVNLPTRPWHRLCGKARGQSSTPPTSSPLNVPNTTL